MASPGAVRMEAAAPFISTILDPILTGMVCLPGSRLLQEPQASQLSVARYSTT